LHIRFTLKYTGNGGGAWDLGTFIFISPDISSDGVVNLTDVSEFSAAFGESCFSK